MSNHTKSVTYDKDSQEFIKSFPKTPYYGIYLSCLESVQQEGILVDTAAVENFYNDKNLTSTIRNFLEHILSNNVFTFSGRIFRQRFGTAMGTCRSPKFANNFMANLEEPSWKHKNLTIIMGSIQWWKTHLKNNEQIPIRPLLIKSPKARAREKSHRYCNRRMPQILQIKLWWSVAYKETTRNHIANPKRREYPTNLCKNLTGRIPYSMRKEKITPKTV